MRTAQGFTLIELLIVISIIAVITGATIPSFNTYIKNQNIKQSQEQVKDDLRTTQNRAMNGQESTTLLNTETVQFWGMKFVEDARNYEIFFSVYDNECNNTLSTWSTYRTSENLPGDSVVRSSSGCIFFSLANGDATFVPSGSEEIIVGAATGSTGCKKVEVTSTGLVTTESATVACP